MSTKISIHNLKIPILILVLAALVLSGCSQQSAVAGDPGVYENGCLKEDTTTMSFVNPAHGYCLLVPVNYKVENPIPSEVVFTIGGLLDVEHPKVYIAVQDAEGRTAEQFADQIESDFPGFEIGRSSNLQIDGEPAVVLDGVPGQDKSRQVVFVHDERVYRLTFIPVDEDQIEIFNQMKQLYKTVTQSLRFLP